MKTPPASVASRFSIEATRPKPAEIAAIAAAVPKGTEIYLPAVPTQSDRHGTISMSPRRGHAPQSRS